MVRALRSTIALLVVISLFVLRSVSFGSQELNVAVLGLAALLAGIAKLLAGQRRVPPIDGGLAGFVLLGAAGLWL